jgi:hypothetical protein
MNPKTRTRDIARKETSSAAPRTAAPASGWVGKPLDGSQYIDVIEEQEYADRRPSAEEQRPILANKGKEQH